jgi:prevent-host-death family protein
VSEGPNATPSTPYRQANLHDAKTHLSRHVDQALDGEGVVIARAGRALVRLVPLDDTPRQRELGFLRGAAVLECDLKQAFQQDVKAMFG